jgi:hypothetical protein
MLWLLYGDLPPKGHSVSQQQQSTPYVLSPLLFFSPRLP